jgi:type VI secretion system protein ImpE
LAVTTATELYRAGRLEEAIDALGIALRSNPTDVQRRTFLFELLCFAGSYERAEKQLDVLSGGGPQAELGTLVYRSALHAERIRQEMFRTGSLPEGIAPDAPGGMLDGHAFSSITDADPRLGARLEVFAAGQYTWLPFAFIETLTIAPPKRLRDLMWASASIRTAPAFQGVELGEVLIPVLTPNASQHPDPGVLLGRVTEWERLDDGTEIPVGQKLLLVDNQEIPILDVREVVIASTSV